MGAVVGDPLNGHTSSVLAIACTPDGRQIISRSHDNTIRIWNTNTGATISKPLVGHTDWVWAVVCSPDGWHIVSGSNDKTL